MLGPKIRDGGLQRLSLALHLFLNFAPHFTRKYTFRLCTYWSEHRCRCERRIRIPPFFLCYCLRRHVLRRTPRRVLHCPLPHTHLRLRHTRVVSGNLAPRQLRAEPRLSRGTRRGWCPDRWWSIVRRSQRQKRRCSMC